MKLRQLHPLFAAEATGIDLKHPDEGEVREIVAAMDRHAVLVFPGQPLSEDEQVAFGKRFGPLDLGLKRALKRPGGRHKHDETIDISNIDDGGGLADPESKKMYSQLANQLWHSDSSFQNPPARYSMLNSLVTTPSGGETEYADLRAAWDSLPGELKKQVENLKAEHYALYSRINLGDTNWTEEQKNALPPVEWPLVRTHPGSGRKLLFVGVHCTKIVGMHVGLGRLLLAELLEHATQREFVYRHEWKAGDLVMWDNRCVLHRGRRYDLTERRELRRISTEDVSI